MCRCILPSLEQLLACRTLPLALVLVLDDTPVYHFVVELVCFAPFCLMSHSRVVLREGMVGQKRRGLDGYWTYWCINLCAGRWLVHAVTFIIGRNDCGRNLEIELRATAKSCIFKTWREWAEWRERELKSRVSKKWGEWRERKLKSRVPEIHTDW